MRLAIVIPYYKKIFFDKTLKSLANQSDKRFKVYIGDDASIEECKDLVKEYQNEFELEYHRFESNLGRTSLVRQWERCLDLTENEDWVLFLGDDDILGPNCVQSFYENINIIKKFDCNVVRFASKVIDANGEVISMDYRHPQLELASDFLFRKLGGGTRSSLSEYIFKKSIVSSVKFKDFPLAWYSDLLAVIEFSEFGNIYSINEAYFYFRWSGLNITSKTDDLEIKNYATFQFYYYLLRVHSSKFSKELIQILLDRLEKTILNNKKNSIYWMKLLYLYFNFFQVRRFISLSLKIKRSIK